MDPKEISKIEETIKENINEETQQSIAQLKKQIEMETEAAITRINNVYASSIITLKRLELSDEFRDNNVEVRFRGEPISEYRNDIRLHENSKYKIILMAIKEKS